MTFSARFAKMVLGWIRFQKIPRCRRSRVTLQFGTSGVRGLVTEMTDLDCYLYTLAFLRHVRGKRSPGAVGIAGDYRSSTPRIKRAVAFAASQEGMTLEDWGAIPAPAVTHFGIRNNLPSIMVTGSHVPDDRNGIKFNTPYGEILKSDEKAISRLYLELKDRETFECRQAPSPFTEQGDLKPACQQELGKENPKPRKTYLERYLSCFPPGCFKGSKVVFYQHSSVLREILLEILEALGAEVVSVGRSERFVPVDTEAVENAEQLSAWVRESGADVLVSADGDGDRPLIVDENGALVRGDVLGILVADFLSADSVSAPVSCNTALEKCGRFPHVSRTRIGSPFVIEAMQKALGAGHQRVVGFEANGGFLTASDLAVPGLNSTLTALPTRDAALPILALLFRSVHRRESISRLVSDLPQRFTQSGLLRDFPTKRGQELMDKFCRDGKSLAEDLFKSLLGPVQSFDFTDGARMFFVNGDIVHLRPSGNAPEFRCYTESFSEARAREINAAVLDMIRRQ